ncbi:MAG: AAA family ATPase [Desulfobacterales bacterium]|jgi:general secretion pathway protein A
MFLPYFNLKENPFNPTIDTAYVYLGHHHEEAHAHLTYAVSEGEGFIVITGDRGVGKTTICRSFLEGLDSNVETAYIDRSTSNPQKLLLYINAEFKIRTRTGGIKGLADALNEFLIRKKLEGIKVAVFIDDAHKLNSDVLEQVRLISNLETSKEKLLQIILIGESKLSQMLNSNDLRQIGQRVSVGYRIGPLSYDETVGYIHHRLTIASMGPPIRFDPKAVRRIYRHSGGIPRNINVVCHQALEIAYQRKLKFIDANIAKAAIRYLKDRTEPVKSKFPKPRPIGFIAVIFCLVFVVATASYIFRSNNEQSPKMEPIAKKVPVSEGPPEAMPEKPVISSPADPRPSAEKADISIEPLQADQPQMPENISESMPVPAEPETSTIGSALSHPVNPKRHTVKENVILSPSLDERSDVAADISDKSELVPISNQKMTHSVQVGAFRRIINAADMIDQLAVRGYSARIVEIPDKKGRIWFTVRIGDHPTLESAEVQAREFMEKENMKTFIRPYEAY